MGAWRPQISYRPPSFESGCIATGIEKEGELIILI
jgi:hypothetical protein